MLTQLLREEGFSIDYFTDLPDQELLSFIGEVMPEAVFVSCTNQDHLQAGHGLLEHLAGALNDFRTLAARAAIARDRGPTPRPRADLRPPTLPRAHKRRLTQYH